MNLDDYNFHEIDAETLDGIRCGLSEASDFFLNFVLMPIRKTGLTLDDVSDQAYDFITDLKNLNQKYRELYARKNNLFLLMTQNHPNYERTVCLYRRFLQRMTTDFDDDY